MGQDIKRIVSYYVRLHGTNNPFVIADDLNIQVYQVPLGRLSGYYKYLKRHRCIFLNSDIENENYKTMVMAHELGHAILHIKENCYFINNNTFLLTSKIEKQANIFASELLLPDTLINEYIGYTQKQLSIITGLDINLVQLKLNNIDKNYDSNAVTMDNPASADY